MFPGKKILESGETLEGAFLRGRNEKMIPGTKILEPGEMSDGKY